MPTPAGTCGDGSSSRPPDGGTLVTHTYDWSGVADPKALGLYPRVSEEQMSATIARIAPVLTWERRARRLDR